MTLKREQLLEELMLKYTALLFRELMRRQAGD